jgi:hypothetical protein
MKLRRRDIVLGVIVLVMGIAALLINICFLVAEGR